MTQKHTIEEIIYKQFMDGAKAVDLAKANACTSAHIYEVLNRQMIKEAKKKKEESTHGEK